MCQRHMMQVFVDVVYGVLDKIASTCVLSMPSSNTSQVDPDQITMGETDFHTILLNYFFLLVFFPI